MSKTTRQPIRQSTRQTTNQAAPPTKPRRHRNWAGIIYTIVSAIIIIIGTYFAIRWAQGDFRIDENNQAISANTGLLNATSVPQGAQVYVNGSLASLTDDIIYLAPGTYDITIQKDGYSPWHKTVQIEQALVTAASAVLYPYSPSLTSITYTGASNLSVSPNGQKLLYLVTNNSALDKNGFYVLDLNNTNSSPRQLSDLNDNFDLAQAQYIWSADSSEVLIFTPEKTFLLDVSSFTNLQSAPDASLQLTATLNGYELDLAAAEKQYLDTLTPAALQVLLQNANNFYLSPDHQKLLYTATGSATLADHLITPLPATNSHPQTRTLEPGELFIYDGYEDKNFMLDPNLEASRSSASKSLLAAPSTFTLNAPTLLPDASLQNPDQQTTIDNFNSYYGGFQTQPWQWLANSQHLVGIIDNNVVIINYDGTNPTVVYSGNLQDNFVLPSPDGKRIFILTSFNPDSPANIYAIELFD